MGINVGCPPCRAEFSLPLFPRGSLLVQIYNCGLMAVFEADLVHKQAEEVFRPIITLFLLSPSLSFALHPSLHFSYSARLGPCLPDNCKQLGKLVAPPSPSRGLLVYNLIEANVKTVKAWEKQDVSVRWNLNCQPVQNIKRVCLIGRQEHKERENKAGKR